MFEQRPCGDALLFIALDVIEKNHHLRMHLQIAYIMLLYDIFLQPSPLPLSTRRLQLFSLALWSFEKQRFALILVFAKNDESVSDRFSQVRGNGKTQNATLAAYFELPIFLSFS